MIGSSLWKSASERVAKKIKSNSVNRNQSSRPSLFIQRKHDDQRTFEAKALVHLLRHNTLVSLYGASGVGKSSFIDKNLLPQLDNTEQKKQDPNADADYFPILVSLPYLRFRISENSGYNLTQALHDAAIERWLSDSLQADSGNGKVTPEARDHDQFAACLESVVSAVDYLQNPVCGFSLLRKIGGISESSAPIVIFDEFEELFRDDLEEQGDIRSNPGGASEEWVQTFHEITDVAEQRFGLTPDQMLDKRDEILRTNSELQEYKTIICFDEDSFALVKQLALSLPSAMRATYRLKGFTHESAIQILCGSEPDKRPDGLKYAKAAVILNSLTSSNFSDQRQLALDRLRRESAQRLLAPNGAQPFELEKTISGSELTLARLLLNWQMNSSDGDSDGRHAFRTALKYAVAHVLVRTRNGWIGRALYSALKRLPFRHRKFAEYVDVESVVRHSGGVAEQFSTCIAAEVSCDKICVPAQRDESEATVQCDNNGTIVSGATIRCNRIGATVRLFRDSRNNLRSVLVSEARNALNRRLFWFLLPAERQFAMSKSDFEEMLRRNPLFQLKSSSRGQVVKLTNPLVLRSLEFVHQQKRSRKYLALLCLGAVLSVLSVHMWQSVSKEIAYTELLSQGAVKSSWKDLFDLNAELMGAENQLSNKASERRWLERRENELLGWIWPGLEKRMDFSAIASAQLEIYTSSSTNDAIANYQQLKDKLVAYRMEQRESWCDLKCASFIQFTLQDTFQYLLLSLSVIDPDFREPQSTLSKTQLAYLLKEIRQFCAWGSENMLITLAKVSAEERVDSEKCAALFVPQSQRMIPQN